MPSDGDNHENRYVLSLDVGTSNVRCHLYDKKAKVCGSASQKLEIIYIGERGVEIEPECLWTQVQEVVQEALTESGVKAEDVECMGISVQRGTFIVWDKDTGKPFHNFIVWQDTRGGEIEKYWNESYQMKAVKLAGKLAYGVSRMKMFLAAAVMNFRTSHVTIRLLWLMNKYPSIKKRAEKEKVRFGALDTWLIWKLTSSKRFCSEISNASSTGIYDPFQRSWSQVFCYMLKIPVTMFPPVLDSDADFGICDEVHFGAAIPIRGVLGDQQSAMFGQCCFREGDVKLTMGTGSFVDINVGPTPHASVEGFYPVTGWKRGEEIVHLGEGSSNTSGAAVQWLIDLLSIESPGETFDLATSVPDSNGVYFVPGFSGLQAPENDSSACGAIMGLKSSVTNAHITRAVLEALAFRCVQIFETMSLEVSYPVQRVVCDGGVTANDFVVQLVSDLIDKDIFRMKQLDMSALGAAFMAGRAIGFWETDSCLKDLLIVEKVFYPDTKRAKEYVPKMSEWRKAVERSKNWYSST